MKKFRLTLNIRQPTYVEADRFGEEGRKLRFYRGDQLVAEYDRDLVTQLTEEPPRQVSDEFIKKAESESPL